MKCPIDNSELVMSERQGIEIDYCSSCRGVWLDRGELDKIIERTDSATSRHIAPSSQSENIRTKDSDSYYNTGRPVQNDYPDERNYHHKKHKKEGFLGDIFDF